MQISVTPFLWYDDDAEEAARFYVSLFAESRITGTMPGPDGKPLVVTFTLCGREFRAINGGPTYKLTEAYSFAVDCDTQAEVDELWDKLIADGGAASRCGWLVDRFGASWQIVPRVVARIFSNPDREKAGRAMQALFKMNKIDIAALEAAMDGR